MKVLSTLWGLIVDDRRLVSILVFSLIVSWCLSSAHHALIAAITIWIGLIVSLWISIHHQIQLKIGKKTN